MSLSEGPERKLVRRERERSEISAAAATERKGRPKTVMGSLARMRSGGSRWLWLWGW